jgi:hypothetical protein
MRTIASHALEICVPGPSSVQRKKSDDPINNHQSSMLSALKSQTAGTELGLISGSEADLLHKVSDKGPIHTLGTGSNQSARKYRFGISAPAT